MSVGIRVLFCADWTPPKINRKKCEKRVARNRKRCESKNVEGMSLRRNQKTKMNKSEYKHLLNDTTPCHDIDTSGSASEHELGDLARLDGHASLTSCLNDMNAWGMTVAEVAEILISSDEEE